MSDRNISRFEYSDISLAMSGDHKNLLSKSNLAKNISLGSIVSNQRFDEGAIIDTMLFIPLETTNDNIFYGIKEIKMSDDRIFISDQDGHLWIFKSDGKFVSQIKKGQGPGEIYKLWDFTYDHAKEILIVYQSDNLSYYDKNGNFLFDQRCPIMFVDFCASEDTGFVFFQPFSSNYHLGDVSNKSVIVTDENLRISNIGLSALQSDSKSIVSSDAFITKNDKSILISQLLNDTIYELYNTSLEAKYIIRYDNSIDSRDDNQIRTSSKFYHSGGFLETGNGQLFRFWSPQNGLCLVFRDKNTGKAVGGTRAVGAGSSIPHYCFATKGVYNGYFISSYIPQNGNNTFSSMKISEESKKSVLKLTNDDNPVLIMYKIKITQ